MEDYEIITAYDGLEAMGCPDGTRSPASDHRRYDAEDGRTIRNDEDQESKNIPIIILSAKTEESDKDPGTIYGSRRLYQQPFRPDELVARGNPSCEDTCSLEE